MPGSDYCETCKNLGNVIENEGDISTKEEFISFRDNHRSWKDIECQYCRFVQDKVLNFPDSETLHLRFDFAEKVLLPHLLGQIGQLNFRTGLKLELYRVSIINFNRNDLFWLQEGHWSGGKSANKVSSM